MKGIPPRTQGLLASGLLAILVLAVFARSTYSGPESTLFQFHNGVLEGNYDAIKATMLQDPNSGPAQNLRRLVQNIFARGAEIKGTQVGHRGRDAIVEVSYESAVYGFVSVRFYMQKPRSRWLVDADRTWGLVTDVQVPGS